MTPSSAKTRSDRQIDASGNDHEAFTQRENSEQADQIGGVGHVDRRQKARIDQRDDRTDNQDQDEKAQILS